MPASKLAMRARRNRERVERACRIHKTDNEAARALGISNSSSFRALCAELDIVTPHQRRKAADDERNTDSHAA